MERAVSVVFAALLAGCASSPQFIEGYDWVKDATGKHPCAFARWVWIPEDQDESGFWYAGKRDTVGYVLDHEVGQPCSVVSKVSEGASHYVRLPWWLGSIMMPGEVVWDHEARHWKGGLVHP